MIGGLVEVMGMFLQGGWVDVGFFPAVRWISTAISTHGDRRLSKPKSRLPGSGGANPIGALAKRILIIAVHNARTFSEKVDFITTPGYLDGPGSREKWGLPPDTGPQVIITNKAILRFDRESKEAYLESYHPDTSVDEVVKLTPWKLRIADDVHETEPPTAEELRVLREVLDPFRMIKIYEKRGYV
jgi:glutaconate CoA-transferase subunit B